MIEGLDKYLIYIKSATNYNVYRCPFCGDSKNTSHGHLNVSKVNPVFRCVRCGVGGHIEYLLEVLNANDIIIPEDLLNGSGSVKIKNTKQNKEVKLSGNDLEPFIINYFQERLGIVIDKENEFGVISQDDYLKIVKTYKLDMIFENVIPFLSFKKNMLTVRNVDPSQNFRYWNYILSDNSNDYYRINNNVSFKDFFKHKTIIVAEGIFDIINVYLQYKSKYPESTVFVASKGSTMKETLKCLREFTLSYFNNIIIYADNDKSDKYYRNNIINQFTSLLIYRNKLGKDFGQKNIERSLSLKEQTR